MSGGEAGTNRGVRPGNVLPRVLYKYVSELIFWKAAAFAPAWLSKIKITAHFFVSLQPCHSHSLSLSLSLSLSFCVCVCVCFSLSNCSVVQTFLHPSLSLSPPLSLSLSLSLSPSLCTLLRHYEFFGSTYNDSLSMNVALVLIPDQSCHGIGTG